MPIFVVGVSIFLLVFLINHAYKRLWDKGLTFDARFSSKEAFEGDTLYLRESLTNKKFLPLPWVYSKTVIPPALTLLDNNKEPLPKKGAKGSLYSIMMYTAIRRRHPFVCQKRGMYALRYSRLAVDNLMHTKQYYMDVKLRGDLLVFPKIIDNFHNIDVIYKHLDSAVLSKQIINPDPFEFKGIRDYLPTDMLKSINFKASAVSQKLMVNIHAPTAARRMMIILNMDSCGPRTHLELYEQGIRLAATLSRHYIEQGIRLAFSTNGMDGATALPMRLDGGTSTDHLYKIFECLARLSVSFQCAPMADDMYRLIDREQVHLFISSNHDADVLTAFEDLQNRGVDAFMVVPYFRGMTPSIGDNPRIFTWDATPEEGFEEETA